MANYYRCMGGSNSQNSVYTYTRANVSSWAKVFTFPTMKKRTNAQIKMVRTDSVGGITDDVGIVQGTSQPSSAGQYVLEDSNHVAIFNIVLEPNTTYTAWHYSNATSHVAEITITIFNYDDKPTYLYKDGTQNVAWDNSGYAYSSSFTSDGGFVLNDSNVTLTMPTVNSHDRCMTTDNTIDVTDYSTLKCSVDGTVYTKDISSVNGSFYVLMGTFRHTSGDCYLRLYLTSTKANFNSSIASALDINNSTSPFTKYLNRIWLEK